jgi:hypothetical protein
MKIKLPIFSAMLDGMGVKYFGAECWLLNHQNVWARADVADVYHNASVISEAEFSRLFPEAPALPAEAFPELEIED